MKDNVQNFEEKTCAFDQWKQSNVLSESPRYRETNSRIMDIQSRLNAAANQTTKVLLEELDAAMVDAESEAMYIFYRLGAADCAAQRTVERIQDANLHYDVMFRVSDLMCSVLTDDQMTTVCVATALHEILRYLAEMSPTLPAGDEVATATDRAFRLEAQE